MRSATPLPLFLKLMRKCRSPSLMSCYLDNKEATEEALDGEWFRTGDVGKIDSKGRLWITDRLKEVIKVKGCAPLLLTGTVR